MNRVGDMGLSIGFFAIFALFGSLDYSTVFSLSSYMNETGITIIGLLLLTGAMSKSSQIPLHSWLPGSMEGPTPVSALIHAATLVTAGLYLLVRSSAILEYSSTALLVITLVGASTAFFAATCGLIQNDLKRIIAFSTISQLGYMVMAVGLSQYNTALMHVVNHAFFKALLFLGAGAVIHSFADQQDVRKMGGLINFLPFTYTAMLVGSLSLLATPWLTGFYSKDLIIELAYAQYSFSGTYAFILGSLTAGITAFYSFRLISLVFLTVPNGPKNSYINSHEANFAVVLPLFILALFSILFGYFASDIFVGVGSDFFANSIFIHPNNISIIEAEFSLPLIIKLLPALLSLIGALLAIFLYHFNTKFLLDLTNNLLGREIYTFLNGKYLFDVLYNKYLIINGAKLGYIISKVLDRGLIENIGPYGLENNLTETSKNISSLDNGSITTYSLYIALGAISSLFIVFTPIILKTNYFNEMRLVIIYIASLSLMLNSAPNLIVNIEGQSPASGFKSLSNLSLNFLPLIINKIEVLKLKAEQVKNIRIVNYFISNSSKLFTYYIIIFYIACFVVCCFKIVNLFALSNLITGYGIDGCLLYLKLALVSFFEYLGPIFHNLFNTYEYLDIILGLIFATGGILATQVVEGHNYSPANPKEISDTVHKMEGTSPLDDYVDPIDPERKFTSQKVNSTEWSNNPILTEDPNRELSPLPEDVITKNPAKIKEIRAKIMKARMALVNVIETHDPHSFSCLAATNKAVKLTAEANEALNDHLLASDNPSKVKNDWYTMTWSADTLCTHIRPLKLYDWSLLYNNSPTKLEAVMRSLEKNLNREIHKHLKNKKR